MQTAKFLGAFVLAFVWLYLIVVQLPLLLTAGGLGWFVGAALFAGSVAVLIVMVWKILKAKHKQIYSNKE